MSELKVNLLDEDSVTMARLILKNVFPSVEPVAEIPEPVKAVPKKAAKKAAKVEPEPEPEPEEEEFIDLEELEETEDLGDLLDEMEVEQEGVTVADMKDALKELMEAKGREAAMLLVGKAFAKMGVKKMDDIPEEKREVFLRILNTATGQ